MIQFQFLGKINNVLEQQTKELMGSCNSKKQEILIFLGSNSQHSIHKALLNYMIKVDIFSSSTLQLNIPDLSKIPFFNKDLINEQTIPLQASEIFRLVSRAKKIIFFTPEYNGATSADLINVFQWISQLKKVNNNHQNPFHHKKVGIISCSYISQRQIDDIKLMIAQSHPKLFEEVFYVDLKTGEIDPQTKQISLKIKERLYEWLKSFMKPE